jgi:hypothetical protein
MATHIVINPDLITFSGLEKAFLDVAGDPASASVTYTVYAAQAAPHVAAVPMNPTKHFATSPDLFGLSSKKTALIVAVTTNPATPSAAVLHQTFKGNARAAISVPSSNRTLGTSFNIPVSDLDGGGTLFIGNPGGVEANAAIQYGSATAAATQVRVPSLGVATFKVAQAATNLLVSITNDVPVVVQLAIGSRLLVVFPIGPAV